MSIVRRNAKGQCVGVRCDFCGKIANNPDGEYTKPGTDNQVAYIHGPPEWERNPDGSTKPNATDRDICEECAAIHSRENV